MNLFIFLYVYILVVYFWEEDVCYIMIVFIVNYRDGFSCVLGENEWRVLWNILDVIFFKG